MSNEPIIDVRAIAPRDRHPLIFGAFDNLAPGATFMLVNDHDPKPLYYQFSAELSDQFTGIIWSAGLKCGACASASPPKLTSLRSSPEEFNA
jgi:uncharacterized protein (DUF2249 family)